MRNSHKDFFGKLSEENSFEGLSLHGSIILKWTLENLVGRICTDYIGSGWGPVAAPANTVMNLRIP
jgi:hypothetical protein